MLLFINFSFVDSFLFTLTHLELMSANSPHLFPWDQSPAKDGLPALQGRQWVQLL